MWRCHIPLLVLNGCDHLSTEHTVLSCCYISFCHKPHVTANINLLHIYHPWVRENSSIFSIFSSIICNICTSCVHFKNTKCSLMIPVQTALQAALITTNPTHLFSILCIAFLLEIKWRPLPSKHAEAYDKDNVKDHIKNGKNADCQQTGKFCHDTF